VDRTHRFGGPQAGGGSRVHGGPPDRAWPELAGVWARRRSRAWDLTVVAWGARGEDGDPYPGWHEWVEGLGRLGIGEGRQRQRSKHDGKRLGREGGERGADLSTVKMAGGVAPFYRVREAVEGSEGGVVRGTAGGASSTPVTGVEARGHPFDEGEMKGRGRRFDSTPTGCGWETDGGVQSGSKPARWAAAAQAGGGRRPRDGPNGPELATLVGLRLGRHWNFQRKSGWAAMAIGLN
jgi:hypothetical protein